MSVGASPAGGVGVPPAGGGGGGVASSAFGSGLFCFKTNFFSVRYFFLHPHQ
jgi:hypothetical protein